MKTHHLLIVAPLLIDAFSSLKAADDLAALRGDFEKTTAAFHQALRRNDPNSLFAHVADDVVLMPPNEAPVRGKAAMRTWYGGFLSAFKTAKLAQSYRVVIVTGDRGSELGRNEWGPQPAGGGESIMAKRN